MLLRRLENGTQLGPPRLNVCMYSAAEGVHVKLYRGHKALVSFDAGS